MLTFLCGEDRFTGTSFEHRKVWVEERLLELARHFAVGVYADALMRNHLQVVLHVDPGTAAAWSPEEVARRWLGVFPVRVDRVVDARFRGMVAPFIGRKPAAGPGRQTDADVLTSAIH